MNVKVGDKVKSLRTAEDIKEGKEYSVINVAELPFITVVDDIGDHRALSGDAYEPFSGPEETQEVSNNTYTLTVSLQGTGSFFTKTQDIVLPTGTELISLISKLNEL